MEFEEWGNPLDGIRRLGDKVLQKGKVILEGEKEKIVVKVYPWEPLQGETVAVVVSVLPLEGLLDKFVTFLRVDCGGGLEEVAGEIGAERDLIKKDVTTVQRTSMRGLGPVATPAIGKRRILENLWRELFSDPSQWWDHRWQKGNAKHPDFKHKKTQEGLWLDGKSNPPWVKSKLATVAAGALKSSIFSWNSRLIEMVRSGQHHKAMEVFQQMKDDGVELDMVTFVPVLNSCAALGDIDKGRRIHTEIMQSGCGSDVYVGSSLVDMYAKCGSVECAQRVFDEMPVRNVVSWNTMMGGYLKCGQGQQALQLFQQMLQAGVMPDTTTFKAVLNACANVGALEEGRHVHGQIVARGWESDVFLGSCLIDMYGKCGSVLDAFGVFKKLPKRDVVIWSAMIQACVICGQGQKALELSKQMQLDGVDADPVMLVMLLNACACMAALQEGRLVHEQILQTGCESNVYVGSSLIDMYAKCGSINDAERVFESMPERDGVCCAAMLGGYAIHGCTKEALSLFEWMRQEGVKMNMVTFILLLSACSHGALIDEGMHYFEAMSSLYEISASVEHYSCVVDLLGRAGRLHEAEYLIKNMSLQADLAVWISLLSACVIHCNVEMGEHVSNVILQQDPGNVPGHVLLSKIYARTGNWDRRKVLQEKGLKKELQKELDCTWIEVNNEMHSFKVGDQDRPQVTEINTELKRLCERMKKAGYKQDTGYLLHGVEEGDNITCLGDNSEKLAIVFGLINTPPGTTLRLFTNLWVCGDRHSAIKLISRIVDRQIILWDSSRFHHFKDGICSCRDFCN